MLGLSACGDATRGTPAEAPAVALGSLTDTEWYLTELNGAPVLSTATHAQPSLRLDGSRPLASGNSGCNTFSGSYTRGEGGLVSFTGISSTERSCTVPGRMALEASFLAALSKTTRLSETVIGTLELVSAEGVIARLRRR